jgi:hypothetical protein
MTIGGTTTCALADRLETFAQYYFGKFERVTRRCIAKCFISRFRSGGIEADIDKTLKSIHVPASYSAVKSSIVCRCNMYVGIVIFVSKTEEVAITSDGKKVPSGVVVSITTRGHKIRQSFKQ